MKPFLALMKVFSRLLLVLPLIYQATSLLKIFGFVFQNLQILQEGKSHPWRLYIIYFLIFASENNPLWTTVLYIINYKEISKFPDVINIKNKISDPQSESSNYTFIIGTILSEKCTFIWQRTCWVSPFTNTPIMTRIKPTKPIIKPAMCMAPSPMNFSMSIISACPNGMAKRTNRKAIRVCLG